MKDLGLLPAAASLVEPAGFYAAPAARAYGASGSFLAFLLERRGPGPLLRAYAGAPFAEAFGAPIGRLEADWHAFLDGMPVPPELLVAAEARFRPSGLLGRRCAAGDGRSRGRGPDRRAARRPCGGGAPLAAGRAPLRRPVGPERAGRRAAGKRPGGVRRGLRRGPLGAR